MKLEAAMIFFFGSNHIFHTISRFIWDTLIVSHKAQF